MSVTRRQSVQAILGIVGGAILSALTLGRRRAAAGWLAERRPARGRAGGARAVGTRDIRVEPAPGAVKRHG